MTKTGTWPKLVGYEYNCLVHVVINCIFGYILANFKYKYWSFTEVTDFVNTVLFGLFQAIFLHCHTNFCLQDAFKVQCNSFVRVQTYLMRVQEILTPGWSLATSNLMQMQFWNLATQRSLPD